MAINTAQRTASIGEIVAEMDRRGDVIVRLEAEIERLRLALLLPDAERRLWFISDRLEKHGYFNRADICKAFGTSTPQASLDIKRWLSLHPSGATYNATSRRYEARR